MALSQITNPYQQTSTRFYTLGILTLVYSFNFIDRQLLAILQEPIKNDLLLSDTELGLLTGFAFALFYVVAGLPIARLADHNNRRTIISWSLAIWSFMTAISGMAQNYLQLFLARVGVGIGEAGCSPPAHSMISDIFPPEQRASGLSIYSLGINIGILFGFLLGGWLNQYFGWRVAFMVVGVPGIILAVIVRYSVSEPIRGFSENRQVSDEKVPFKQVLQLLWSKKSFRYLSLAGGLSAFAGYGMTNWLASFIIRTYGMSTGEVGSWLALSVGIMGGAGTFASGYIADKLARKDKRWYMWLPAIASVTMIPFFIYAMFAENVYVHLLVNMIPILMSNVFLSVCIAVTHSLVGFRMRAFSSAIFFLVINVFGLGMGPVFIGYLSDLLSATLAVDSLRYSMVILISVAALLAAVFYFKASHFLRDDLATEPEV